MKYFAIVLLMLGASIQCDFDYFYTCSVEGNKCSLPEGGFGACEWQPVTHKWHCARLKHRQKGRYGWQWGDPLLGVNDMNDPFATK